MIRRTSILLPSPPNGMLVHRNVNPRYFAGISYTPRRKKETSELAVPPKDTTQWQPYPLFPLLNINPIILLTLSLTANGTKTNWKSASWPDSGILQCLGRVGIAPAKATRALARDVTFLHQSASLQRADRRSEANWKHCSFVEFSLSVVINEDDTVAKCFLDDFKVWIKLKYF